MINWIMTVIGLILLVAYYQLLGSSFFIGIKIKRNRFAFNLISGFILTWALGWIIGFPCELFSTSWNVFAIIFTIVLIIAAAIALYIQYKYNEKFTSFWKKDIKEKINIIGKHFIHNLCEYWFVYLFVIVFSILSITNMQPYTLNNYNDDHYIVRVTRLANCNALFNENYYSGTYIKSATAFSYALQQGQRMFNTYELVYGYVGTLLHINLVFFCRVTMTAHNYLITFMLYTLFASIFLRSRYSQFGLLCFSILIIPAGYLAKANIPIRVRMWENWRFQTAMYMGGSIVRNCAFPILIYYFYNFLHNKTYREILFFAIIFIMLLSFQSTGISYILIFIPIAILAIILNSIWEKQNINNLRLLSKQIAFTAIAIVIFVIFLKAFDLSLSKNIICIPGKFNLMSHTKIDSNYFKVVSKEYLQYYRNVFTFDFFAKFAFIPFIIISLLSNSTHPRIIIFSLLLMYLLFALNKLKYLMALASFEAYCTARMLTALQMVIILLFGISLVKILEYLPYKKIIYPILSLAVIMGNILYVNKNYFLILKYTSDGDAVVNTGFSTDPVLKSKNMIAPIFNEIGDYFNKMPKKKYGLYSSTYFYYKGIKYGNRGFLLTSKNIRQALNIDQMKRDDQTLKMYWNINAFTEEKKYKDFYNNYRSSVYYLKKSDIEYLFTTRLEISKTLNKNGWTIVSGGNNKGYWLLKSPFK